MSNILLIVASGKSSRFGGFPKAFCRLGNVMNAENTAAIARKCYDKVYIGVNSKTFHEFNGKFQGGEMFPIVTGQGDAHSLLKCLEYIGKREEDIIKVSVCWGDAVFVDEKPFEELLASPTDAKVSVACALDKKPYAWFELTHGDRIRKAHFAKEEGFIEEGMHDQSLFHFDFDFARKYLNEYRESLGIPYDNDENNSDQNEMKLLFSFEYLIEKGYEPARCVKIEAGKVLSFNTQEELEEIRIKLRLP